MNEEIIKYKRYILQKMYSNITNSLSDLEKHINDLIKLNMNINIWKLNEEIYNLIKNINSFYNNEINSENFDKEEILLEEDRFER